MAEFAVLITYREVIGKEPSVAELHAVLKQYQRSEVVFLLAKLNCLLGTWQNKPKFDLDIKLSDYLLADFKPDLQKIRLRHRSRIVFSRLGLLYLIKQACIACPESGPVPSTRKSHSEIGVCVLMTNDLLLPFVPAPSDGTLKRLANLLPFADYVPHDEYAIEIGRTQMIFGEISKLPSLVARPDFIDIAGLFKERMGFDQKVFCELVFGCATRFLQATLEQIESNPEMAVVRSTYFSKSKIPNDTVAQFLSKLTITESVFAEKVKAWNDRPANDLTLIQAFPLIEIQKNVFACLDPGFLIDKAGRGLYWSLFFEVQNDQKGKLATFWGAVFESYVNHILKESYAAGGKFIPEPKFSNGDAAFDACIIEDRDLLVFEHKSSIVRADAKYGGDVEKLKKELDLKFIEGDAEGAKGLSQLSNHLVRFLSGDKLGGINAGDVSRVYPVLVCLESTTAAPYLGSYFSERFRGIFSGSKFRQVVTPVITLGVSDVENLLGYIQSFTLGEIFESYHSKNKSMLTSLSSSEIPILKNAKPKRNIVTDSFSEFSEAMERDLFPEGSSKST